MRSSSKPGPSQRRRQLRGRRTASSSSPFSPRALASAFLAAATTSSSLPLTAALWFLPEKRFRFQGLIDAGTLGLNDIGAGIVAWGDWDGDQYLDVFLLSDDRLTLQLKRWDHTAFRFAVNPLFAISSSSRDPIVNVVPSDYNHDGHLDVLLMTQKTGSKEIGLEVWLGRGREGGSIASTSYSVPSASSVQPILIDGTGDLRMDLLGQTSTDGELQMWRNVFETSSDQAAFNVTTASTILSGTQQPCQLSTPHSSAFVDLNGDCMADLFLVCSSTSWTNSAQSYQIWTASRGTAEVNVNSTAKFDFSRSGSLASGAGPLSFADMNRDGTIDVVYASCDSSDCYINIAYNRQVGLCEKKASAAGNVDTGFNWKDWWYGSGGTEAEDGKTTKCRKTEDLCSADDEFAFDMDGTSSSSSSTKSFLKVPFSAFLPGHKPLLQDKLSSTPIPQPTPLVIGDFDKDGYPDILLLSIPPGAQADGTGVTAVHLLQNVKCSAVTDAKVRSQCIQQAGADEEDGRWVSVVTDATEALSTIQDARSASWMDIDDDGSLDIVLQRGRASDSGVRTVSFIQNNYYHDAFFLKALTLNGACASNCEASNASGSTDKYKPWGASLPGASYKFTVLDPNGNRRAQQVGQLAQSSYLPLLTPYSYFGLGRTNNYVEKLFVGSTLHGSGYSLDMEGVIPNSQVFISPYYQSLGQGEPQWHRELYLQPGDWIPWVTVVLVTLIIGLCGFVFAMNVSERREDEREKKRAVHAINFDALG